MDKDGSENKITRIVNLSATTMEPGRELAC